MKQIKNKTKRMLKVEAEYNQSIESILHTKWVIENKPIRQVMHELGIGYAAVYNWLKQAGIYSRQLGIYKSQDRISY